LSVDRENENRLSVAVKAHACDDGYEVFLTSNVRKIMLFSYGTAY
jgi:hypothetical protein